MKLAYTIPLVWRIQWKLFEVKLTQTIFLSRSLLQNKKRHTWESVFLHSYRMFQNSIQHGVYDEIILQSLLLHDIVEDSCFRREDVASSFWSTVADIVEGMTCLDTEGNKMGKQPYFEKFLRFSYKEWRILFVKILDSIDNLETLHGLPLEKQQRFIREKKEIFLPIFTKNTSLIPSSFQQSYITLLEELKQLLSQAETSISV